MSEFTRIEDVDAFCLKLYSGDKKATLKVTSEGWRRIIDEIGLGLLLAVLQHSTSAYSIMFVSRAASECLETIFSDVDQLTQFTMSVYDLLCARDAALNAAAKLALRQLICIAVQRGYRYSPTLAQMASSVCTACINSIGVEAQRDRLRVGCEVLADLVVTLNEHRMSSFASDVSVAKSFRDEHLLDVYRLAVEVVKQVPPRCRSEVAAALRLAQRVLDFDFTCDAGLTDADDNPVTRTYPDTWTPYLLDVTFVDRLWSLYRVADWEGEVAQSVLEVLAALVSLRKAIFTDPVVRQRWYDVMLLQTQLVMERCTHLEEEETLSVFARLLNRIKPNCEMDELMQQDVFARWMQSLRGFTKQCFTNWRHASTSLLSLLSTWARLIEARSYSTYDTTTMAQASLEVVRDYIDCIHSRVHVFTAELDKLMRSSSSNSGDDGGASAQRLLTHNMQVEYPLDDDREGVRLEMDFVLKIAAGCGEEAWGVLEAHAEAVGQTLLTQLRGAPANLSAEHVVAVEEGAWSMHLLNAALLSSGAVDQGASYVLAMLLHSLMQLKLYTAGATALDRLPGIVRGHFASSAVQALGTVLAKTVSVYVHSNRKTSAFVEQLSGRLRQCDEMDASCTFGVYFVNLAVYTLWAVLNTTNMPKEVRIEALALLDEWTSTPSVLRLLKETQSYKLVMNLTPESFPAPLRHTDAFAARYLFVRCVAQVLFLDSTSFTDAAVSALMEPLLTRVTAVLSYPSPPSTADQQAALALTLCDVRGVLSCTERRPYRIVMDMIEPSLYPLADAALHEDGGNELAVVQLLELVNELAVNKNQRIVYGVQSARPVLIFRYASHVLVRSARLAHMALTSGTAALHQDAQSPLVEWGWKVMRLSLNVACNIIQGGWCNLGVLQLYADPALVNVLDGVWRLLSTLPHNEFATRPKVCAAVVKVVNALSSRFFHWFWVKQPPAEVSAVVGFVEALAFPAAAGAVESAQQNDALQTLDRLINCCWVRTLFPTEEAQQAAAMKTVLLQADGLVFHRIATCALERSVAVDNHAMRKLLPSLFYVEGEALAEVAQYFCNRGTTPAASAALRAQFAEIQRQITAAPDITNETINELQNSLHNLMDTLKVSL
jgi:exportin-7